MRKLLMLLGLLLIACSSSGTAHTKAETITCTAAYRSDVSQPIEREESITFTDRDAEQAIPFTDMVFRAIYSTGKMDNERALHLRVTDASAPLSPNVAEAIVYQTQLYQLDPGSGPQNQFQGGHGFTGLNYSYHPTSQAEMQFWCEAD